MTKNKGKKTLEKPGKESIQGESKTPKSLATCQFEDETKGEINVEPGNTSTDEDTIRTTSGDDIHTIIGSLVAEMRNLRQTVHHDILDLQKVVSQQKVEHNSDGTISKRS